MFDLALSSGQEVDFSQKTADGTETKFKITPTDAVTIQALAKLRAAETRAMLPGRLPQAQLPRPATYEPSSPQTPMLSSSALGSLIGERDKLRRILSDDLGSANTNEATAVVKLIAEMLSDAGERQLLSALADELEREGRTDLAQLVKNYVTKL